MYRMLGITIVKYYLMLWSIHQEKSPEHTWNMLRTAIAAKHHGVTVAALLHCLWG